MVVVVGCDVKVLFGRFGFYGNWEGAHRSCVDISWMIL